MVKTVCKGFFRTERKRQFVFRAGYGHDSWKYIIAYQSTSSPWSANPRQTFSPCLKPLANILNSSTLVADEPYLYAFTDLCPSYVSSSRISFHDLIYTLHVLYELLKFILCYFLLFLFLLCSALLCITTVSRSRTNILGSSSVLRYDVPTFSRFATIRLFFSCSCYRPIFSLGILTIFVFYSTRYQTSPSSVLAFLLFRVSATTGLLSCSVVLYKR